ncbi:MAG: thiolase family protein [Deltaproteobacteria bacterium]|nr:thiolase family protein [Deltaproteobacteria bacterium]
MREVVIASAVRTPIGKFHGALSSVRPDDLAAGVLADAAARAGVSPETLDEVFLGCANQAGEDNRNVARMASLLAGFPYTVPGVTLNRLCASGLEAIVAGSRAIGVGDARRVLVGGVESMSRAPYSMPRGPQQPKAGNFTAWDTSLGWRYPNPRLEARFPLEQMGETAENVAEQHGISRADQDAFAVGSHRRAVAAQANGWFASEILPVAIPGGRKGDIVVSADEGPRADTTVEALGKLSAAFRSGGSVTAGNSSTLNDGAAALVLVDAEVARADGLPVLGRIRASASAGVDPRVMGLGPVPSSRKALERAGLSVGDIELWELNEAFAAQSLAVLRELEVDEARVNVHGGAIALGHPLGCSGARIVVTLLAAMARTGATLGAASLCVGVGQGMTLIVER